jgi:hypothetical protein
VAPASDRPRVSTRATAGTDTSKSVFRRFGSLASTFAKKLVGDTGQLYRDNRLQAIKSKEMEVAAVNITLLNESGDLQSQQNDLLAKIIAELKGKSFGTQDTGDLPDIDLDRRGKGRPPKPRGQRGRFGSRARERLRRIRSTQRVRQMQNLRQRVTRGVQTARQVAREAVTRLRPPTPATPRPPAAPAAQTPAPRPPSATPAAPRPPVTPAAPAASAGSTASSTARAILGTVARGAVATAGGVVVAAAAIRGAGEVVEALTPESQRGPNPSVDTAQNIIDGRLDLRLEKAMAPFTAGQVVSIRDMQREFNLQPNETRAFINQLLRTRDIVPVPAQRRATEHRGSMQIGLLNIPFHSMDGKYYIKGDEVDEATFNEFIALKDQGKREEILELLVETRAGRRMPGREVTTPVPPAPTAPATQQPAANTEAAAASPTQSSPGLMSRIGTSIFGRRSSAAPAPATPALGAGAMAASPYGADVGSMGLEPQSSVTSTPPASTRAGSHMHTEGEIKDLEGIVRGALGPNRREHVGEVVNHMLQLYRGQRLPNSNFLLQSRIRDYINSRPELRDPTLGRAVQQMDAGGRETHRMVQEQQAGPESLASPMSYVTTGVRQEQLPSNISSILQLLSGVEFHSIKIEARSIEFDGTVKTAAQASTDQYATRIAAPAAGPVPAAAEVTPESTPTPSAPSAPSAGSSAPASQPAARPAPGGSGMLSRLGRSIFGGGGGGSSSPSSPGAAPSAPSSTPPAQQTAAAPATPSIGGGGGGGGGAGASPGTITEVVERGPGFNVVKYDDGKVERRTGARNWRNNNPGNIEFSDFARRQGAIGTDGRFAIFPTYEAGKRAKEALLFEGRNYSGLTIAQAITRYAPPSENDTAMYIRVAAGAAGVAPSTPMKDLNSGQRQALLAAMERVEGFRVGNVQVIQQGTAVASAEQAPPGPGPALAAEGTQMAAADQAQMRGEGQQVVVQVPPPSAQQRIASADQQAPSGGRGEVSLNRRLEKQVA